MSENIEKTEYSLRVTYVDNDRTLLQIHGHPDKDSVTKMEELLFNMTEHFENNRPAKPAVLSANILCCVKLKENRYFRARILSPLKNGFVVIQLVDYGDIENVHIDTIRFLTDLQNNSVVKTPVLLKTFVLSNIAPIETEWIPEKLQYIKSILIGQDFLIKHLGRLENHNLIQIKYQNIDFSKALIRMNIAKYVSIDTMFG